METNLFKVPVTKILSIRNLEGSDRLEIAKVYDFDVVTQKGKYKVDDVIIYVPVDSILDPELEVKLFPPDSKIKLDKHRVRAAKIRGFVSQGMIIDPKELGVGHARSLILEQNLAEILKITKYEPPFKGINISTKTGLSRNKRTDHKLFHSYNGIENVKWYPLMFQEGEEVIIEEKLHGTNARLSYLPYQADTWLKRLLIKLRLAPKYEKNYGSNNVQISRSLAYKGFYGDDIYGKTFKKIKAFDKIKPNETIYGEIIGEGIQKNYNYGHKEPHFVLFDVKVYDEVTKTFSWLNPELVEAYAKERGFDYVPVLYSGPYNKEATYVLTKGASVYNLTQKAREGIVIKSRFNYNDQSCHSQHKCLKWINEDYLLDKDNTDNH